MTTTVQQEVEFNVPPQKVYDALTDPTQHAAFRGAASEMNGDVGAAFAGHEGPIVGRNLELVPGSPIVQAWRVTAWPDGIYSVIRYVLEPTAAGTRVTLHHTGLPDGVDGTIADGWQSRYWTPMREFFAADA